PQPERVDVVAAPADDRCVVGHRLHRLGRRPYDLLAARQLEALNLPAIAHVIDDLAALEFPGVARQQPLLREFLLPSFRADLAKQSVLVTDAVAPRRNTQGGHALHE